MPSMQLTVEKEVACTILCWKFPSHQLLGLMQAINKSLSSLGAIQDVAILLCQRAHIRAHTFRNDVQAM